MRCNSWDPCGPMFWCYLAAISSSSNVEDEDVTGPHQFLEHLSMAHSTSVITVVVDFGWGLAAGLGLAS